MRGKQKQAVGKLSRNQRRSRVHSGVGYTGTGRGLGFCKRIVERQGGTITATDNPAVRWAATSMNSP